MRQFSYREVGSKVLKGFVKITFRQSLEILLQLLIFNATIFNISVLEVRLLYQHLKLNFTQTS